MQRFIVSSVWLRLVLPIKLVKNQNVFADGVVFHEVHHLLV